MIYIEEIDEDEVQGIIEKIKYYICKFFYISKKENKNGKIKYKIPKYKNKQKIANKISKSINEKNVVLDNNLIKNIDIRNILYSKNINILEGKELFKYLIIDSLKLIENLCRINLNTMEISILANDINGLDKMNIVEVAKIAKRVNVITSHIDKFKKIEENILDEYGILINVTNNKNKSLKTSDIIINLDMPRELINKYNINKKTVFLNVNEKIEMNKKFNGINITNYDINWDSEFDDIFYEYSKFSRNILYESLLKNNDYVHNMNKIKKDKIKIERFIGVRGVINKEEFKILKKY